MKGNQMNGINQVVVPLALGLVCAGIVFTTLAGKTLPLITGPRAALIALLVLGIAACMGGIGQVGASGRWFSLPAIAGHLLGVMLLIVFLSGLLGWKLPFAQTPTQAVAVMAVLMAVKFLIGIPAYFFRWL